MSVGHRRAELHRRHRRGDPAAAATTIFAENILGGTCSRVCPVEVLCQRDCVLVHEGRRPIEIGALQRYATDWAYANGVTLRNPVPANGKRVAVIGAGPAGPRDHRTRIEAAECVRYATRVSRGTDGSQYWRSAFIAGVGTPARSARAANSAASVDISSRAAFACRAASTSIAGVPTTP